MVVVEVTEMPVLAPVESTKLAGVTIAEELRRFHVSPPKTEVWAGLKKPMLMVSADAASGSRRATNEVRR